ncbi:anti-sigma factor [Streptomyces sp. NBS 14/10]|uniref:anti-sigma factor n=1 Tax=Streptomyces sp. NBS 14/10 TaxID=1945643 RepID=UPI000B7D6655|nr:anti-sigma factor [Streptomyces sp. NBS 14/10]KAK1178120.1 anti-sigma factor [Streptomyces sp. NBS 14/10]
MTSNRSNDRSADRPSDRSGGAPAYRGGRGRKAHALAGAYALNALDLKERRRYEKHLARCPGCAQEVRDLAQGAVRLARAVAAPAPPQMRQRVLAAAQATPQEAHSAADGGYAAPPVRAAHAGRSGPGGRRARGGGYLRRPVFGLRLAGAVAALSVIAAAVLAVELVRTRDRLDQERGATRAVEQVLSAPDAHGVSARDAQGRGINAVTSRRLGAAVVTVSGLPAPPGGRTYQLWMIDAPPEGSQGESSGGSSGGSPGGAAAPRSAGLLKGSGEGTPLVTGGFGAHTERLAVTLEPDGGSTRPTTNPVVQLALVDP